LVETSRIFSIAIIANTMMPLIAARRGYFALRGGSVYQ